VFPTTCLGPSQSSPSLASSEWTCYHSLLVALASTSGISNDTCYMRPGSCFTKAETKHIKVPKQLHMSVLRADSTLLSTCTVLYTM
jgi:hypothetical protein